MANEQFLKKMAEQVIKPVQKGVADDTPKQLDTPGKRALYSDLKPAEDPLSCKLNDGADDPGMRLALNIDMIVKQVRPAAWRGNTARENIIKAALLPIPGYPSVTRVGGIEPVKTARKSTPLKITSRYSPCATVFSALNVSNE